jgi:hypothetical protein
LSPLFRLPPCGVPPWPHVPPEHKHLGSKRPR